MINSKVVQNLHQVLIYMAESNDFNRSISLLFVHDAIKEIERLEALLDKI